MLNLDFMRVMSILFSVCFNSFSNYNSDCLSQSLSISSVSLMDYVIKDSFLGVFSTSSVLTVNKLSNFYGSSLKCPDDKLTKSSLIMNDPVFF